MTTSTKPLAEQTPVEIDTQLAALYETEQKALSAYGAAVVGIMYAADAKRYYGRGQQWSMTKAQAIEAVQQRLADEETPAFKVRDLQRAMDTLDTKALALREIRVKMMAFEDEFKRRGGWTRAFLAITNGGGHVHNGMNCSTCHNGLEPTRFGWFPQYSGKPEAEIVEDAGERACTTCYPTAPVSVLSRPTKFFSEDEKAKAKAREEREAKRAAAKAEVRVLPWTESGLRGLRTVEKEFKTLRGATNALAGELISLCWYGPSHPSATGWLANVEAGREALGSEWDYDKALATARKKVGREGGQSKF